MHVDRTKQKFREWLRRYMAAEILGTILAVSFAYIAFAHTHSYVKAAGAGFVGEGLGFYGYFVTSELLLNGKTYATLSPLRRLIAILAASSTNLVVEFAPAELIDNLFIRPFLMFYVPQHLRPYAVGFIVGKLAADLFFYVFAICGYEFKRHLYKRKRPAKI